jgi:hypothetical protein
MVVVAVAVGVAVVVVVGVVVVVAVVVGVVAVVVAVGVAMNACVKTGAIVHMLAHDLVFHADLYLVGGAMVVRANGPLKRDSNCWPSTAAFCQDHKPTYELHDRPSAGFWREDLGIFVVPADQLKELP